MSGHRTSNMINCSALMIGFTVRSFKQVSKELNWTLAYSNACENMLPVRIDMKTDIDDNARYKIGTKILLEL